MAAAVAAAAVAETVMVVENPPENSKPFAKRVRAARSASDVPARRRIEGGTPAP